MKYLYVSLIGALLQAVFIFVEHKKKFVPAVVFKGLASVAFIVLGFLGSKLSNNAEFSRLIVAGLILGGIGDVLLNLRFVFPKLGQKIFLLGIVSFLAGHVVYLIAQIKLSGNVLICVIIGLVLAVLLLLWIFSKIEAKMAFKIFGVVYIGAVVVMTVVAIGNLLQNPNSSALWLFAVGAVAFTLSDIVLIFNTFGKTQKFSLRITNLSLYYIGQILIALCLQAF